MTERIGGKYEIIKEAGSGGGGRVYQVYDPRLQKNWAAKLVTARENSLEEQVLSAVQGTAFSRIVDVVEDIRGRFLIMDWIEGETLQRRLERCGRLPAKEAAALGLALSQALGTLHGMQPPVLYLDCKPSNIMLEKNGGLRLIDFGSAALCARGQAIPVAASPGYAAPEQTRQKPAARRVDERSDIFGLGRTLYAALTGYDPSRPPYARRRLADCSAAIPAGLIRIVEKCMEPEPQNRFQTMSDLQAALTGFLEAEKRGGRRRLRRQAALAAGTFGCLLPAAWQVGLLAEYGAAGRLHGAAESQAVFTALPHLGAACCFLGAALLWQAVLRRRNKRLYYETLQNVVRTAKRPERWPAEELQVKYHRSFR